MPETPTLDECRARVKFYLPVAFWPRFLERWALVVYEAEQANAELRRILAR